MAEYVIPSFEIPTIALLYKIDRLQPSSTGATNTPSQIYNNKICYIRNDITVMHLDAIVNAANKSLLGGGGIDHAIHKAAGRDLVKECRTLNGCETGSAKITNAYKLPCKKVIHAVGPNCRELGISRSRPLLQSCYRTCLELAVANKLQSIAFSCLSAGIYGYPTEAAAETALEEVRKFLESGKGDELEQIVFCVFTDQDQAAYDKLIPKFFPPTEEDLPTEDEEPEQGASEGALLAEMPAPPSFDPAYRGEPDAKKVKVAHVDNEDGWESVEMPDSVVSEDEEMVTVTKAEARSDTGTSNDVGTAPSVSGGYPNNLMKDW